MGSSSSDAPEPASSSNSTVSGIPSIRTFSQTPVAVRFTGNSDSMEIVNVPPPSKTESISANSGMEISNTLLKSTSTSPPAGKSDKANACSSLNSKAASADSDKGKNWIGDDSKASNGNMAVISPKASVSSVAGISIASNTSPNIHVPCTSGTANVGSKVPARAVSSDK